MLTQSNVAEWVYETTGNSGITYPKIFRSESLSLIRNIDIFWMHVILMYDIRNCIVAMLYSHMWHEILFYKRHFSACIMQSFLASIVDTMPVSVMVYSSLIQATRVHQNVRSMEWVSQPQHLRIKTDMPCRQTYNVRHNKSQNLNASRLACSCLCPIHWIQLLSRKWECCWSSADRRHSNYIWVIKNRIAY